MGKLRVLIAEDHAIVRAGIRSLLESEPDIEVVGEAARGDEVLEKALLFQPDLVLMDIAMPGISGIEATSQLKERLPQVRVLVLTMHDDEEFFFAVVRAGASGYILKHSEPQELLSAIRSVGDDQTFLSPTVARVLLEGYMTVASDQENDKYGSLSPREREVLQLVASGQTNREIAQSLFLSVRTVEKHRQAAMHKLDLSSPGEVMKYAIRRGLITTYDSEP